MKDRVVQFPNRYKLTPVSGDTYDLTPEPGIVTEPGTDLNKANLLKDTTAALYGLGADAVPDDVLALLAPAIHPSVVKISEATTESDATQVDIAVPAVTTYESLIVKFYGAPVVTSGHLFCRLNNNSSAIYCAGSGSPANSWVLGQMRGTAPAPTHFVSMRLSLVGTTITGFAEQVKLTSGAMTVSTYQWGMSDTTINGSNLTSINFIHLTPNGIGAGTKIYLYGVKK